MKKILRKLETFGYLVTQAFAGIVRNGALSFASVAVLIACLLITGSFVLIIQNINYNMQDTEYLNRIVVYMDDECSRERFAEIYSEILSLDNVDRVGTRAVSKQEALEEEKKKNPDHFSLLEEGDNPYRDSVVITYVDAAGVEALEIRLHEIEEVDDVVSRIEVANTVESLKSVLFFVSVGFFVTLLVVTVFIIITTIRVTLFSRQKEIEMMDALGATRSFIVLPFIIEGFVLGVVAAMLAFFAQGWIYGLIDNLATKNYALVNMLPYSQVSLQMLLGFMTVGVLTGIVGSLVSLAKYMRY